MRTVAAVVRGTFTEVTGSRVLYALLVFFVLNIGLSFALGQLSFTEQARISLNFGFTALHLSAAILACFAGSALVFKDFERRTVWSVLTRSITREQYLLGKFLGLSCAVAIILLALFVVVLAATWNLGGTIDRDSLVAVLGIFLEAEILLALVVLLSCFATPFLTAAYCIGLFLIGHGLDGFNFFAQKSDSVVMRATDWFLQNLFPNLERLNWRSYPLVEELAPVALVGQGCVYALSWVLVLMAIAALIFRRKDLV